jgi:predicted transcriptional regulator
MTTDAEINEKLDALIRLTAIQLLGERTGAEAIALLARANLNNELIAELVGTTPATVRSTRSRVRRAGTPTAGRETTG